MHTTKGTPSQSFGARAALRTRTLLVSLVSVLVAVGLGSTLAQDTYPRGLQGMLTVEPASGVVGSQMTLTGQDFEPGTTLDVVWMDFDGQWDLERVDGEYTGNFLGRSFTPREESLGTVEVAEDGTFAVDLTVPEGFGGTHDIFVREEGDNLNKAGFAVEMHAEMSPQSGPPGTDITMRVTGIDSVNGIAGWYALLYDNNITGFMTAVETGGTAEFVIPAVGEPGPHLVQLRNSPFNAPYLALESSPWAHLPEPHFTFTVTDGEPILPGPVSEQARPIVPGTEPEGDGPAIWVNPFEASVYTPSTIFGKGLQPNTELELAFANMAGSRVTAEGYGGTLVDVATVTTDADGAFAMDWDVPDTLGGSHRLIAVDGEDEVAHTYFQVAPYAFPIEPASGEFGTPIEIHVKGIGWTQTNNIFAVVIDNVFMGYACGFSTNGDVVVPLIASWGPGIHYIDLYPSFYRNRDYSTADEQPFLYREAILTYQDHPEQKMHYRYTFEVPESE